MAPRWKLAVVALFAACGGAAAAPLDGALDAATPAAFEGVSTLGGPLDLLLVAGLLEDADARVSAGRVVVTHFERAALSVGGPAVHPGGARSLGTDEYVGAEISFARPQVGLRLVAYREAGAPVGSAQAAFETSDALAVHAEPARKEPLEGAATVDDPHFRVPLGAGRATLTGNFTLYARGLDVTVREGRSGARVYETGNDSGQSPLPVHERKERWIVARVEGGRLAVERTVPGFATLYAGSLRAAVDGVVRLPDARGGFESGERAYLAEGDKVVLQGRLSLDLAPGAPARLPDEEARMRVAASGDLRSTNLRGVPLPRVAAGAPLPPAEAAILVCAGALLGRFLWVSYWRLQPDAALANAARRRLWETARARPGLSLRDLARAAGVSRTTAQYHAGVLARFGFLTLAKERDDARTVRVFALSDDPEGRDPRSRALAIALTREPARRLARALLDGGPATAPAPTSLADVARRTGLSKPTALRHLRALGRAGVVEARGRSPQDRSYALTPEGVARLRAVPALAVEA